MIDFTRYDADYMHHISEKEMSRCHVKNNFKDVPTRIEML